MDEFSDLTTFDIDIKFRYTARVEIWLRDFTGVELCANYFPKTGRFGDLKPVCLWSTDRGYSFDDFKSMNYGYKLIGDLRVILAGRWVDG